MKKVTIIGGGTGSYVILTALKDVEGMELNSVVTMTDSGGSTGRLRDQLGVLPPGDLRQALVALSESPEIWRKIFAYRFDAGDLEGHNFGNIFLSVIERITGSLESAIEEASHILNVKGKVVPVTYSDCTLCAEYEDGSVIEGEDKIDNSLTKRPRIKYMYLDPDAGINPGAEKIIKESDYIIFPPGDLYTSVIPNLLVNKVSKLLSKSKAKKVYFVNLMNKRGQTDDYKASDYVYELERYSGTFLDYVIINSITPTNELIKWYKRKDNVVPVEDDLDEKYVTEAKVVRRDLLSKTKYEQNLADRVKRSFIRHDPEKIKKVLIKIIK
jgi:uncharacterized cofD-like protein